MSITFIVHACDSLTRTIFQEGGRDATYLSCGCCGAERKNIFLAKFREGEGCERGYGAAV